MMNVYFYDRVSIEFMYDGSLVNCLIYLIDM